MNSLCYRTQKKETESVILTSPKLIALKRALLLSVINLSGLSCGLRYLRVGENIEG